MEVFYWIGLALWVYKDAGRRKLNASLWGLLILITNLVGFIVYLIYNKITEPVTSAELCRVGSTLSAVIVELRLRNPVIIASR